MQASSSLVASENQRIQQLIQISCQGLMVGLLWLAAVVLVRRLSGAMADPPALALSLAVALGLAAACSLVRTAALWQTDRGRPDRGLAPLIWYGGLGSLVWLLFALAIALPLVWSAVVFWLAAVVHETLWWAYGLTWPGGVRRSAAAARGVLAEADDGEHPAAGSPDVGSPDAEAARFAGDPPGLMDDQVTQQISRFRAESGDDRIAGLMRCEFLAGERTQALHVAFCPPLDHLPELHAEAIQGPAASVKVGELQLYGARFDVRLHQPSRHAQSVIVHFATG